MKHRALPNCITLRCGENDVGDDGLQALASALHAGAMPALKELSIGQLGYELPERHKLVQACHGKRDISINGRHALGSSSSW